MTKTGVFFATDAAGLRYRWTFGRRGDYWQLTDPEGYMRILAKTWAESVPMIRQVLGNYDMKADIG